MSLQTSLPLSEFRVEKLRTDATLTLVNGASVRGSFFIADASRTHAGPEGVRDVLNGDSAFFPFALAGGRAGAVLYNREHVVAVELADRQEARRRPGYDVATERPVTMTLTTGVRLRGSVRVFRPHGRDRLSDFVRTDEVFIYLETDRATYLINIRHVVELAEENPAS